MTITSPTAALDRIKTNVMTRIEAFHVAKGHARCWADGANKTTFVVATANGAYLLADRQDLEIYHRADIAHKRSRVVCIARPS